MARWPTYRVDPAKWSPTATPPTVRLEATFAFFRWFEGHVRGEDGLPAARKGDRVSNSTLTKDELLFPLGLFSGAALTVIWRSTEDSMEVHVRPESTVSRVALWVLIVPLIAVAFVVLLPLVPDWPLKLTFLLACAAGALPTAVFEVVLSRSRTLSAPASLRLVDRIDAILRERLGLQPTDGSTSGKS